MHILLIHQAFVTPNESGGTRHYEFARHFVEKGHKFTIIASNLSYLTGKPTTKKKSLVSEQTLNSIRILRSYTFPSLHRSFVWRVISFISFMFFSIWAGVKTGPVDLVMGTSPPIFQAVSAYILAILKKRPFMLEIRDLWPEFGIDMGILTNPILIRLSRWLEAFLYARASHLVVNSPAFRDYLIIKGVPHEKITIIPNGVDPGMFSPENCGEKIREKYRLDGRFVVTYAGALGTANDIPNILNAARRLKADERIHFLLVGDGKERSNLEKMAKRMVLHNVTFTGVCTKSEMKNYLAASDAGLATLQNIPMFRTTYPNKVFDYMAAGRPTVLAIDGVIREVIEKAKGGVFVVPGNAAALADAILKLVDSPEDAWRMGENARAFVVEHFDRRKHADSFMRLLDRKV